MNAVRIETWENNANDNTIDWHDDSRCNETYDTQDCHCDHHYDDYDDDNCNQRVDSDDDDYEDNDYDDHDRHDKNEHCNQY